MKSLECLTARCLWGIYWLMGLLPLPGCYKPCWLLLALIVRCIWLAYFVELLHGGFSYLWKEDKLDIGNINGTALYIGYSLLGLLIQMESVLKQRVNGRLEDLIFQSQLQLQRLGMSQGYRRRSWRLLLLIGTQGVSDVARTWANAYAIISPIHLISLPQKWLLRFRYVQLLEQMMELNQRAFQLRNSLLSLATGNDIWQPYGLHETQQLQTLRLSYDCIFECYATFSDCYGWGMLGLQLMCGYEFVSNAYWIITETYQSKRIFMLVYNGATFIAMGILITALFWHGDAGAKNVSKLLETASVG